MKFKNKRKTIYVSKSDCFKKSDIARAMPETEFKYNWFINDLTKVLFYCSLTFVC